jgi:hypothetical protein
VYGVFLTNEEKSLQLDKDRYNTEKILHIREYKRIRSEDSSKFNNFPILDSRYLLLNLIGKGGFSEVFKVKQSNFKMECRKIEIRGNFLTYFFSPIFFLAGFVPESYFPNFFSRRMTWKNSVKLQ